MKKWLSFLLIIFLIFTVGCKSEEKTAELTSKTPTEPSSPLETISETKYLKDYIALDPAAVVSVDISDFSYYGIIAERCCTLIGQTAVDFAETLSVREVVPFEGHGAGQGSGANRYTFTFDDGSTLSFCEDSIFFYSDAEVPSLHDENSDVICLLRDREKTDLPADAEITLYYYTNAGRLSAEEVNSYPTLSSLIPIRVDDVVTMSIQQYYPTTMEMRTWNLRGDDAKACADYMANSVPVEKEIREPMGPMTLRFEITYTDESKHSFCINTVVFLDHSVIPSYKNTETELLGSVLFEPSFPVPDDMPAPKSVPIKQ